MRMTRQTTIRHLWKDLHIHPLLLLGILIPAVTVQYQFRTPSAVLYYLMPLVGLSTTTLSLTLFVRKFSSLSNAERMRTLLLNSERIAAIPMLIFFGHSLIVLANGIGDYSAPVEQQVHIVSKADIEVDLRTPHLVSWADIETVPQLASRGYLLLSGGEALNLWGGERVIAHMHGGTLGLPWVSSMERDEEYYYKQALRDSPRSAVIWRSLTRLYQKKKRWDDMMKTIYGYLDVYPYDYTLPAGIGSEMLVTGRFDEAIPLLEYAAGMSKLYEHYQLLGHAWQAKDKKKAIEIYTASIPLAPDDWEVYFHLAETYSQLGRSQEAVAMYRQVLERRPDFPEMEDLIREVVASSEKASSKQTW